jgi:hypothetical protein
MFITLLDTVAIFMQAGLGTAAIILLSTNQLGS